MEKFFFGNKPVLVFGAGPSLDKTLDFLTVRFASALIYPEKRPFRIICVDTCLSTLLDRGIKPDLVVILESQHWNLDDFIGFNRQNIQIAMDLSALPRSGIILSGNIFLFFTPWTKLKIFDRLEDSGLLPIKFPALGSVGLSAVAIARHLTQGKVITAGLDFSFTLDSYHARSTPGHKKKLNSQNRFLGLLNANAAFADIVFTGISKTGNKVYLNPVMRQYRDLFEQKFSAEDSGSEIFDLGGSGLPLGVRTLSEEEACDILSGDNQEDLPRSENLPRSYTDDNKINLPRRTACLQVWSYTEANKKEALQIFIQSEINRLTVINNILTGAFTMDTEKLADLIDACDYLWAHFPDYAETGRRPGKEDLETGSPEIISFLKRIRAETDPFLKIWNIVLKSI